jgi:Tfp pilus assembly protein FimV
MKQSFSLIMLLLAVVFVLSCATGKPATPPPQEPAPQPVETPPPPPPAAPAPPPTESQVYERYSGDIILEGAKTYRVVWGDTLTKIARRQYGSRNGYYFPLILLASRNVVTDPDKLIPGMNLTIPDLQRNLNNAGARQKIKDFLFEIADVYNSHPERKWGAQTRNQLRALASSL